MTERLYYEDAYLTRFRARIIERGCDPCEVYLDRTAFYPTSGGQPFDTGKINGVTVVDVIEETFLRQKGEDGLSLVVDGIPVTLTPFIKTLLMTTVRAMVSTLKGCRDAKRIRITIG